MADEMTFDLMTYDGSDGAAARSLAPPHGEFKMWEFFSADVGSLTTCTRRFQPQLQTLSYYYFYHCHYFSL